MTEYEHNPQQPNVPNPWSRAAPDPGSGPPEEPVSGPGGEPATGAGDEPVTGPGAGPGPVAGPGPGARPGGTAEPGGPPSTGWADPPTDPGTGFGPGYPHAAAQPGLSHGGHPSGYAPPPGPGYPGFGYPGQAGQPYPGYQGYVGPPAPAPTGRGRRKGLLAAGAVLALGIAALGGGIAGASIYAAQSDDSGTDGSNVTQVVDAPQLDYSSLAGIASQVSPSVVEIQAGQAGGSGVVLSQDGYILTNAHVVEADPGGQIAVRFSNGDTTPGTLVGSDSRSDIAVVEIDPGSSSDLTPATFGDSSGVLVGDTVLAIGSPLSYSGSVTQGIVSGLDRTLTPSEAGGYSLSGLLQSDAAINSGNSGGALVNLNGEVIGINTAIAVQGQNDGFLGVGFAIPSNQAADVANQLIAGEEVDHPFLGVRLGTNPDGGAVITDVNPGGPADEAGIQPGDVVVRFGDRQVTDSGDLVSAVQAANVGETVEVEFERDGSSQTATVTLTDSED